MPRKTMSPIEPMLGKFVEDRPFRMSELPYEESENFPKFGKGNCALTDGVVCEAHQRNRFFGGICLALPLSALLWGLVYLLLQRLAF